MVSSNEIIGGEKKAAGSAGWVMNRLLRFRGHALHHGLDQGAGGEVLARPALGVRGVFFQQPFVDVSLDIGIDHHPLLPADHVDDLEQLGRVLDLVLRLGEDPRIPFSVPRERSIWV